MLSEEKIASTFFNESSHLLNIFGDKKYRGWYKTVFYSPTDIINQGVKILQKNVVVRFRLPDVLPIYDKIKKFNFLDRKVGIHRLMVGRDLEEDIKKMLEFESANEYLDSLNNDQIQELLSRGNKIVTIDCNKIPYLELQYKVPLEEDLENTEAYVEEVARLREYEEGINKKIKEHIEKFPDFVGILIDVLNSKITVDEAENLSDNVIHCEFKDVDVRI